jgi:hypothetical protein
MKDMKKKIFFFQQFIFIVRIGNSIIHSNGKEVYLRLKFLILTKIV